MNSIEMDDVLKKALQQKPSAVPSSLVLRIEETLASLPDRAILMRRWRRQVMLAKAAACIVLFAGALIATSVFLPQTISKLNQLPIVGAAVTNTANWTSRLAAENGLTLPHVTDKGVTITIRRVIYDGLRLAIDYTLDVSDELKEADMDYELKVNDVSHVRVVKQNSVFGLEPGYEPHRIDTHTFSGTIKSGFYNYRPTEFNLQLNISRVGDREGEWSFTLPVRQTEAVKRIVTKLEKTTINRLLRVNGILQGPLTTTVLFDFNVTNMKDNMDLEFELLDDQGKSYDHWNTGTTIYNTRDNSTHGTGRLNIQRPSDDTKFLILRPFFYDTRFYRDANFLDNSFQKYVRQTATTPPSTTKPIVLTQGPAGNLLITKVDYETDKVIVRYRTEGSNPQQQSQFLWMQDEQGQLVSPVGWQEQPQGKEQIKEFPALAIHTKPTFVTVPVVAHIPIPELEVRIDLPR